MRLITLLLAGLLLLLLPSCGGEKECTVPPAESDAITGTLAVGIAYGYREYARADGFSYGIAQKWEMRPVGKVTINFCAPESNTCRIALTIEDSASRLLGETGLLSPGTYLSELQLTGIPEKTDEISVTVRAYDADGRLLYTFSHHETLTISD